MSSNPVNSFKLRWSSVPTWAALRWVIIGVSLLSTCCKAAWQPASCTGIFSTWFLSSHTLNWQHVELFLFPKLRSFCLCLQNKQTSTIYSSLLTFCGSVVPIVNISACAAYNLIKSLYESYVLPVATMWLRCGASRTTQHPRFYKTRYAGSFGSA